MYFTHVILQFTLFCCNFGFALIFKVSAVKSINLIKCFFCNFCFVLKLRMSNYNTKKILCKNYIYKEIYSLSLDTNLRVVHVQTQMLRGLCIRIFLHLPFSLNVCPFEGHVINTIMKIIAASPPSIHLSYPSFS